METRFRKKINNLTDLVKNPESFDFFQAIRLIERDFRSTYEINFVTCSQLYFPHAPIKKIIIEGGKLIITQSFFGLTGQNGVLPYPITELVIEQISLKNFSLYDFLNIFNHRLIQLYYKAWSKNKLFLNYEKNTALLFKDNTLGLLKGLSGQPWQSISKTNLPPEILIYYSGLLSKNSRSKEGLIRILVDYFKIQIDLQQFTGEWICINTTELTKLHSKQVNTSCYNSLGIDTVIGKRTWQNSSQFTLIIKPANYKQFMGFLPNGPLLSSFRSFLILYVGIEFKVTIKLQLNPKHRPSCILRHKNSILLGWNSWLL